MRARSLAGMSMSWFRMRSWCAKCGDAEVTVLGGGLGKFEHEWFTGDEPRTIEIQLFPINDREGRTFGIGAVGSDVTERVGVERALRESLEFEEFMSRSVNDGNLVVFSQPIVDARTGQLAEEELLVRMIGPRGELIAPGDFLPQAQRFGRCRPSTSSWSLVASSWPRPADMWPSTSRRTRSTIRTRSPPFSRNSGGPAGRVSFEITESSALASIDTAERFSNDMRLLGCPLALDDFGTGFGTLTNFRRLALTILKIDRSFVSNMIRDESVVKMIVGIAKEFGLLTTAEGVEDAETRTRLVELGVDQLQGYLIGAPRPATTTSVATNN